MRVNKYKSEIILTLFVTILLVGTIITINTSSRKNVSSIENNISNNMKTIYMKADCQKIILYKPVISIVHWPFMVYY